MLQRKKPKRKRCKVCNTLFDPRSSWQRTCSPDCAFKDARTKEAKAAARKERKRENDARKQEMRDNDRKVQKADAKRELHKYIRTVRDAFKPCVSCGNPNPQESPTGGQWDAGHYRSVGACPELEFEPLNIAKQCKRCNAGNRLSGNPIGFRNGLVERLGEEVVQWLDGPHPPKHYTVHDFREMKELWRDAIRGATMKKLTTRQREVLEFIKGHIEENGESPSQNEIGDHFGIRPYAVYCHLNALEDKKVIKTTFMQPRSIEVLEPDPA